MEKKYLDSRRLSYLQTQLGNIFKDSKRYNLNSHEFLKKFIKSKEFKNIMLKYSSCPYWDSGSMYVVGDFTTKHPVSKGKTLSDLELQWLGSNVLEFIYYHKAKPDKIADSLSKILKYCDYLEYHSPQEIVKECKLDI